MVYPNPTHYSAEFEIELVGHYTCTQLISELQIHTNRLVTQILSITKPKIFYALIKKKFISQGPTKPK